MIVFCILDFKQMFRLNSLQFFEFPKKLRKIQTREKIFPKKEWCWTVFYHMLSNCSF